jgi:hypothetical protein
VRRRCRTLFSLREDGQELLRAAMCRAVLKQRRSVDLKEMKETTMSKLVHLGSLKGSTRIDDDGAVQDGATIFVTGKGKTFKLCRFVQGGNNVHFEIGNAQGCPP